MDSSLNFLSKKIELVLFKEPAIERGRDNSTRSRAISVESWRHADSAGN